MLHEDEGVGVDAALASRRRQGEERKSGPLLLCYRQGERERARVPSTLASGQGKKGRALVVALSSGRE